METFWRSVKRRNLALLAVLGLVLPLIYWTYWWLATAKEMRRSQLGGTDVLTSAVFWVIIVGLGALTWFSIYQLGGWWAALAIFASFFAFMASIAWYVNYWTGIKRISSEIYSDDLGMALATFIVVLAPVILIVYVATDRVHPAAAASIILPVIPMILAQIQLNRWADAVELWQGTPADFVSLEE